MSCRGEFRIFTSGISCNLGIKSHFFHLITRRLEEQREQRITFERAEVQKLKQRGQPLCVARNVCDVASMPLTHCAGTKKLKQLMNKML